MKTKTRAIVMAACAILLVATTMFATMAFLTSADSVKNTFTVGNVKITLDEEKVDVLGETAETASTRVKANDYKLLPGHTYMKDPTVTVLAGSEKCYVRMLVTLNNVDVIDKLFPNADLTRIFVGFDSSVWVPFGAVKDAAANTRTYEFRYYQTVDTSAAGAANEKLLPLFTSFKVPGILTGEQLAELTPLDENDKPMNTVMDIVAQAIQADGFDTADAAWASFPTSSGK